MRAKLAKLKRLGACLTSAVLIVVLTSCQHKSRLDVTDAEAIELVKHVNGVERIEAHTGHFDWQVVMWCTKERKCPRVSGGEEPQAFPIRVVCYCDVDADQPLGWFFEANLDSKSAQAISGSRKLQRIYDLP
jgi:hypothetical protein